MGLSPRCFLAKDNLVLPIPSHSNPGPLPARRGGERESLGAVEDSMATMVIQGRDGADGNWCADTAVRASVAERNRQIFGVSALPPHSIAGYRAKHIDNTCIVKGGLTDAQVAARCGALRWRWSFCFRSRWCTCGSIWRRSRWVTRWKANRLRWNSCGRTPVAADPKGATAAAHRSYYGIALGLDALSARVVRPGFERRAASAPVLAHRRLRDWWNSHRGAVGLSPGSSKLPQEKGMKGAGCFRCRPHRSAGRGSSGWRKLLCSGSRRSCSARSAADCGMGELSAGAASSSGDEVLRSVVCFTT